MMNIFSADATRMIRIPWITTVAAGFCLLTIFSGCKPDPQAYRFHNENLKGPVKKVVQRTYRAIEDSARWSSQTLQQKRVFEYNREGRLTEKRVYGPDTSIRERFQYKIASNKRVETRRYDQEDELTHITIYSYPWIYGSVASESRTPGDSLRWYSTYSFDRQFRETQQKIFGPEGRLNYEVKYRYNQQGLVMQERGVKEYTYLFKNYDRHRNWTRRLNKRKGRVTTLTLRVLSYYKE